jgi:serine/threonine protein kinase
VTREFVGKRSRYRQRAADPLAYGRVSVLLLAEDCTTGDEVVVKTFRDTPEDSESVAGFYREIDAVFSLRHQNILEILDYGTGYGADGTHFLALPFMRGGNLRTFLRGRAFLPLATATPLLRQVAEAIDFAHGQGIIHGDIKPENVLLDAEQHTAFLSDFGVSRHFDTVDQVMISTVGSQFRAGGGTSAYLSPEQLLNDKQTARSDIYAFGLVAYELLVGRLPFDLSAPIYRQMEARIAGRLLDPVEGNPAVPRRAAVALRRALDPEPTKRPSSAVGFIASLEMAKEWDVFIAHAGPDVVQAESLYAALAPKLHVFLDSKCLRPGDNWDAELARAQRESLVTAVLVSSCVDQAYYEREEIAAAIRMARESPRLHRVIPIFLDEALRRSPPYGLTLKHGLAMYDTAAPSKIADALERVLQSVTAE